MMRNVMGCAALAIASLSSTLPAVAQTQPAPPPAKAQVVPAAPAPAAVAQPGAQRENPFLKAKSWAFQLVNLEAPEQKKIADSAFDLVVIDGERFPDSSQKPIPLTRAEVDAMKKKPDGSRRLVIAYFSIGEAEDYRSYWKPEWNTKRPSWVGKESKEWQANFYINYWDPVWQDIVLKFSEQIVDSGFDGFYIDRADAYYNFGDTKLARDRMEAFVIKLTSHIRARKPDAAILVQNAEELLDRPGFVKAIDGIAKEDLLYGISHKEEPNKKVDIDWSTKLLKDFHKQNKAVFVIEYIQRLDYVRDAKSRLDQLGFVMYMGPRGLASLNTDAADIANYKGPSAASIAAAAAAAAMFKAQKAATSGPARPAPKAAPPASAKPAVVKAAVKKATPPPAAPKN